MQMNGYCAFPWMVRRRKKLFLPFSFHKFLFSLLPSSDRQRDVYSADPSFLFPDFYRVLNWREKKRKESCSTAFSPPRFYEGFIWESGRSLRRRKTSGKRAEEEGRNNNILFLTLFAPESFYPGNSEKKLCFPPFWTWRTYFSLFSLAPPDPKMITGCGGGFFGGCLLEHFVSQFRLQNFFLRGSKAAGALVSPNCSMGLCSWGHNYDDYMSSPRRRGSKGTGSLARNYAL